MSETPAISASQITASRQLADHAGVRFVTLERTVGAEDSYCAVDPAARTLLSPQLCRQLGMLPIAVEDGAVLIASAEPVQYLPYDVAAALGGRPVSFVLTPSDQLARAMEGSPSPAGRAAEASQP
jgi:type IV pilus assembly protein PilB